MVSRLIGDQTAGCSKRRGGGGGHKGGGRDNNAGSREAAGRVQAQERAGKGSGSVRSRCWRRTVEHGFVDMLRVKAEHRQRRAACRRAARPGTRPRMRGWSRQGRPAREAPSWERCRRSLFAQTPHCVHRDSLSLSSHAGGARPPLYRSTTSRATLHTWLCTRLTCRETDARCAVLLHRARRRHWQGAIVLDAKQQASSPLAPGM